MTMVTTLASQPQPDAAAPSGPYPLYFGAAGRECAGWLHVPAPGAARSLGVVICNPFGYEWICAHRSLRHLAELARRRGFPALRFDYPGTGDATGTLRDPGLVRAWLDSIVVAADTLRRTTGVTTVALVGVRLGATLAAAAAAESGAIDRVVLFAPCRSGRAFVREQQALRAMMQIDDLIGQHPPLPGEEAAGFLLAPETIADLGRIDLTKLAAAPAPRVLLVERDDLAADTRVRARLEGLPGVTLTCERAPGYAEMVLDPHKARVPDRAFATILAWLEDDAGNATAMPAPPAHARLTIASGACIEEPVQFGRWQRITGIFARPATLPPGDTVVLLLNAGAVHRVGPNRMYVEWSRAWAAAGVPVLRLDLPGIGESPPAPGGVENDLYAPALVTAVDEVLADLRRRYRIDRVIACGLCAGAYVAFHAALRYDEVIAAILLNPQTFYWKPGDSLDVAPSRIYRETRHYKRSALRLDSWRRALAGQVDLARVTRNVLRRASTVAGAQLRPLLRRVGGPLLLPLGNDIVADLELLAVRGVSVAFVFSAGEAGLDYLDMNARATMARLRDEGYVTLEVIDGADHTFTPVGSHAPLERVLTRRLLEVLNGGGP